MDYSKWTHNLLEWFSIHSRDFYWRKHDLNHFQWLVLEVLLRRSKAEKVNDLCHVFFRKYKLPKDMVKVSNKELANDLKSIGYQKKRCIILKEISLEIINKFKGNVPATFNELCSIKHIGIYIASAYLTFYLNSFEEPCIDTNVIRIVSRFYKIPVKNDNRSDTIIRTIIKNIAPKDLFKEFNYALLDLGGTICTPQKPRCMECPIKLSCCYFNGIKFSKEDNKIINKEIYPY